MAKAPGFEPGTARLEIWCSIQLSYASIYGLGAHEDSQATEIYHQRQHILPTKLETWTKLR